MIWVKAFHLIFVITWFSGLFYLPRLFVYHAMSTDKISVDRFKIMERKLFYGIIMPSAILATVLGLWLLIDNWLAYKIQVWMHIKLAFVVLLWLYQMVCAKYLYDFKHDTNTHGHVFYRWFNEVPVVFLLVIVIMVIVRP